MMESAHNAGRLSSGEKRSLLARLLRTRGREHRPFTLSFTQQRLWFMDQLEPGRAAYNIRLGFSLKGRLDVAAFEQSLNEIVRRHESLRTSFSAANGQPVQIIVPRRAIAIQEVDLSALPASSKLAVAETLAPQEGQRSFDLQRDPLCRARLVRLERDLHHFLLTMHHIISDGWSMELFYRELTTLYETFSHGQVSPLSELSIQYVDYAQWQRDWLQGDVLDEHLSYWKRHLAGAPALLELFTDRPRPPIQSYRGKKESLVLSKELTEGLRALSLREGATLFMTLLAAFKVVLFRYSGQTDVIVGTPVANRNRTEVEGIVGPLVNTLVLRSNLAAKPSFRKLLRRVTETALAAYSHQELPFDVLLDNLNVKRDLSYNPVFQVMFSLHKPPAETLKLSGIVASRIRINTDTTKFDLNLAITEGDQGLRATLEYNTDLFDQTTIRRMLGHFAVLLTGIVADPDQSISELPLLAEEETHCLIFDWNDTARDFGKQDCVHGMFEEQVATTPDRVAVVYEDDQVSYEQLNRRSNQLANYLIAQAVQPEDKVAICLERSVDMITAVLAIQKAGASYVPLDPSYPIQRLGFMLDDTQASVLVTQVGLLESLPQHRAKVVCMDADREAIALYCAENLSARGTGENLAYVLYTSGSTGLPKGVQIEQRAVTNFLNSMRELVGITEQDRMLAVTTLAFDIAGLELFLPLIVGARVEVASRDEAADGEKLKNRLIESRTTVMQATPASWRMLLQAGWHGEKQIRILCGGEALSDELADQLKEAGRRVWNLYGPTETTIWSAADRLQTGTVTIGQPIANTQIYILDEHLELAPTGVTGDIYIAGKGVGRGYLNLAEKTADKFIPDHFSKQPGARMYATGDRGRYRTDGKIRYEGRVDHQIKLRGYRIELAEIEAILNQHEAVDDCIVVVREDSAGEQRLVAYLVCNSPAQPRSNELSEYLKQRLPGYMVPSWYVTLTGFPLTSNGKVDRRALPEPLPPERDASIVGPRNAVEEIVAGIWSEVLRVDGIGIEDDFFELGGHSLLATQVMSRIRQAFNVEVPLRTLFESPTVAGLASSIEAVRMEGEQLRLPAITPAPRDQSLPASFSQSREWFLQQLEPNTSAYNIPTAVGLRGPLAIEALRQSINEIVRRHEALRTSFIEVAGQPVQVISPRLIVNIPIVTLEGLSPFVCKTATRRLARLEAQRPFNLAEDPLVRASVLRIAEDNHVLLLTMHHIVSDGWSRGIFDRELESLYQSFVGGEQSTLAEPTIQYADFACWQRQWLDGPALDAQVAYWKQQLQAAPAVLELPTDRPRPPVQTYHGATETILISKELSERLRELSRKNAVTLYMTLLSAVNVLLCRYANQTDILAGTYIANRNRREIEGLIGFFVNTLIMRTDLSGNPRFSELLGRVRKATIEAFANQDVPFEKLLESLQVERARSHTPLFQVMFVHQTAAQGRLKLPGVDTTPLDVERTRSNFDLTLVIQEWGEALQGKLEYNTDLFDQSTAARLLGHLTRLLEGIVANPEERIFNLPLITDGEQRQLLVEWKGAKRSRATDICIHDRFEAQVESAPDAIAVEHDSAQVTYAELNRRANRLAHYLRKRGVKPDVLVGICIERSVDMLVSMLSVLKAGGAYVALDPAYPAERIAYMIKDSQTSTVITGRESSSLLAEQSVRQVRLDAEWEMIARESPANPIGTATADNLAYVIYTSGSTGKPKGVMVQHRSLMSFIETAIAQYGVTAEDRILQFASINFDASVEEIYPCLMQGATLVLRTDSMLDSTSTFLEQCREKGLSVLDLPTTYWHQLTEEIATEGLEVPAGLRLVIIGGEKAVAERLRDWRTQAGEGVRLMNSYGPTEATVVATIWEPDAVDASPSEVPIGRVIDNVEVYVLAENLQPAPIGVHGECHIGGVAPARGYFRRPDLTAEKFIPNPFCNEPGGRLYKTGDLVRYRDDGNLEYVGRTDNQVKVRGYRIELGEIETALSQHISIKEAVAQVVENPPGDKRLIAYLVLNEDTAFSVSELRNKLKRQMPEYMLPTAFIKLDRLPRTANGKIDRRALASPDSVSNSAKLEVGETHVAPRTAVEELLAGIWADLLEVEEVGVDENFFDLGGHSLLAAQVVSRIRQAFQVEAPLRSLFDSPTVAGLAEVIEQAMSSGQSKVIPAIEPAARDQRLRLSSAQERLWFLDKLSPGSSAYNIPMAMRLSGKLNLAALEQSLGEIIRRHEVLRTRFELAEEQPVQVIAEAEGFRLTVVDLENVSERNQADEARRLASLEACQAFELSLGPVLRGRLLKLAPTEHVLLLTVHHIASDGWSTAVLIRELVQLYDAFTQGGASPLRELTIQYADYAEWQRQLLDSSVVEEELNYWRQKLGGNLPVLDLPTDHPRPAVVSDRGAREPVTISMRTSEALKQLSRREGVTLFMTLLAAFKVLLSRYSGQREIAVGTLMAGRSQAQTEGLIGFFINTLVLRSDLSGDPTFRELLAREREVALEGHMHQEAPFEKLVQELQPERDMSRPPLCQAMFVLQNAPKESVRLPGLKMSRVGIDVGTAHFELSLVMVESKQGLKGTVEYSTDLFESASIRRMIGHFVNLLDEIAANAERRLSELEMLSEAERRHLLKEWNDTDAEYPKDKCIPEMLEEQAYHAPDRIALVFEDQQVTYAELNRRANQLGHHLRQRSVGPEQIVGLHVDRSVEMVVGLFGILKAGGAYLPLDPQYPIQRLRYMLDDARVKVLVSTEAVASELDWGRQVVRLDADWPQIAEQSDENPQRQTEARNTGYVIYTSGSTGAPKGAMIEHRGVFNMAEAQMRSFGVTANSRGLQFSSLSFDASIFEIIMMMRAGGRLILAPKENLLPGPELVELLRRESVTHITIPPSALSLVPEAVLPELETIIVAGEVCSEELVRRWGRGRRFFNAYGPTEATVWSSLLECEEVGAPTIGRPIANVRIHILDEQNNSVPPGARGEIYITGESLARGYIGRADTTAERFLPNARGREGGERLYRTGDLGRYREDGEVEYIGRADDQVKVRGHRIELGEIETVLNQHKAVSESVVIVREDSPGEKQLVAYLVCHQEAGPSISELREYLKQRLPAYMAPGAYVMMQSLPLTPNGKLDRRALPVPDANRERQSDYLAPSNAVEEIIAAIWSQLLRVESVSIEDNFFDLGGHSLLATQVVSRIRQTFQVEVPLRSLFDSPTVAGLAEVVEGAMSSGQSEVVPPIKPVARHQRLRLSSAQERLWFLDKLSSGSSAYNLPTATRLSGKLDLSALEQSLGEIVRRHEVLRTRFEIDLGRPVQVIGEAEELRLAVVDLQSLSDEEMERQTQRLASVEAARAFDLSRGPVVRASLLKLSATEHVLLRTVHHIASDGWSTAIFTKELVQLYERFSTGEPSPLAEPGLQYADYAQWQREMLESATVERQLNYWRKKLGGYLPVLELPIDKPRPALASDRGTRKSFTISKRTSEGLKQLSRRDGVTLFMTLVAAFKVLLSRYSGQREIVVGTPMAGRNHVETEELMGFFINMLVLRSDLSGDPTFREVLAREREVALEGHINQDVPFERLVDELQPERDMSRTPLFQAMFALQNAPKEGVRLQGLMMSPVRQKVRTIHYELSLAMAESEDGLNGTMEYCTDLFEATSIRRMVVHYANLLEEIVADSEQRVSGLVSLSDLPLLPDKKVECRARVECSRPQPEAARIAPRTRLEQTISNIWSRVLQVKKLGVNDNFFDLGGSSLTLIEVSYELKETLGIEISVIELFEYTTISELAGHLSRKNMREPALEQIQARASKQREAINRRRRIGLESRG